MAWFLLSALFLSAFTGLAGAVDLLRPTHVTLAAEGAVPAEAGIEEASGPVKQVEDSLGVELEAASAALVDTRSGELLYAKGQDRIVPIASITKLMTAMVLLDADPDWDATVTMIPADEEKEGIPYLRSGDVLTVRDAFLTAMIGSANNAALAVTRSTGMSREAFVDKMNAKARRLGLTHTEFSDPTGYDEENLSTALDVARLTFHALGYEAIRDAMTRTRHEFRTQSGHFRFVPATNILLDSYLNDGEHRILGGKTGYTDEAGYTLVIRAAHGQADVIGVVLGSPTIEARFQDQKALLSWGFRTFSWE